MTPTANAIDIINTRPSGTIGTSAATIPSSDARRPLLLINNWLTMVSSPAGISSQVMTRRI